MPWSGLPERDDPWHTCSVWFWRWQVDGIWQRLLVHTQTRSDAVGEADWDVLVCATIVGAHQHAAGRPIEGCRACVGRAAGCRPGSPRH